MIVTVQFLKGISWVASFSLNIGSLWVTIAQPNLLMAEHLTVHPEHQPNSDDPRP